MPSGGPESPRAPQIQRRHTQFETEIGMASPDKTLSAGIPNALNALFTPRIRWAQQMTGSTPIEGSGNRFL
jgi:hypothetical protein